MRKHAKVLVWVAVTMFVSTIIFAWGMDITRSKAQQNIVGTINGQDFEYQDYQPYLERLFQQEQAKTEGALDGNIVRELRVRAWDNLVADHLLSIEMDSRKITVSDDELVNYLRYQPPADLQNHPSFQTDGAFDYQKYIAAMADPDPQSIRFWASVEQIFRPELRTLKLQNDIVSTIRVSENEIRDYYLNKNEKATVEIINVFADKYTNPGPEVTEEEIRAYYDRNRDNYKIGERAALDCIIFSKDPTEDDWERVKTEVDLIKNQIDRGEDFSELAIAYSEDGNAKDGGDLGWFGKNQMVAEFEETAMALGAGEFSDPVRTSFGWHLIAVDSIKDRGDDKQIKARHILLRVAISENAIDNYYRTANLLIDESDNSDFATAAAEHNVEIVNTGLFAAGDDIDKIGYDNRISNFGLKNEVGTISPIYETDASVILARVAEHAPAGVSPFEEAKELAEKDYILELAMNACLSEVNNIHKAIQEGAKFDRAAKDADINLIKADGVTREGYIRGIGRDPLLQGAIFSLKNPGDVSGPIMYGRGCALVKMVEIQTVDLTRYGEVHDSLETELLQTRQVETFNDWYKNMIFSAEIENYLDEVFSSR